MNEDMLMEIADALSDFSHEIMDYIEGKKSRSPSTTVLHDLAGEFEEYLERYQEELGSPR